MRKNKSKQTKEPLLFIHQPKFNRPQVPMQKSFTIKKTTESQPDAVLKVKGQKEMVEEQAPKEKEISVPERKKRFAELNVEERILFFINNLPNNVPKPICEFITSEVTYKGVIVSYDKGLVSIRTLTSPKKLNLKLNDITSINIIGF